MRRAKVAERAGGQVGATRPRASVPGGFSRGGAGIALAPSKPEMIQSLVPAMQAQWHRHEVLANNLANVSTAGFKQDDLTLTPLGAQPASA